jgi:hypothetical protein
MNVMKDLAMIAMMRQLRDNDSNNGCDEEMMAMMVMMRQRRGNDEAMMEMI